MPKEKNYRPRTAGMRYKDYSPILASQVRLAKDCKGYEAFKEDVNRLRELRSNYKLVSIVANHWMKMICELDKKRLIKYVDEYEKGMLDLYKYKNIERPE